jgi:two-component system chemotaxis response regulator CheY
MKRILIIDDSEAVRRQVAQTLGPAGYDVVEAADGMEGHAVIKSAHPALVLCDLNMPRMGGMELLGELARTPPLPVMVMLTTEAQPALIRRARELGAVGWIVKPFKADLLIAAVNKLTAREAPVAPAARAAS